MGTDVANDARSHPLLDVFPGEWHGYCKEREEYRERQQDIACCYSLAKVFGEVRRERCDKHAPRVNRAEAQVDEHPDDDEHPPPLFCCHSNNRFRNFLCHAALSLDSCS
jgi:hypothetical protein